MISIFANFPARRLVRPVAATGAAALLSCALLTGCASQEAAPDSTADQQAQQQSASAQSVTFTDALGAEVTVSNPQRVVACMGSFADIWQLAGGTLVGASSDAFADYGIDETAVQSVGDFSEPDLEAILACDPDFVIMTSATGGKGGGTNQADLKDALEASGVTVAYFNVTTFDDYLAMLRTCCDITGRDDLYEQNGTAVQGKINQAIDAFKAENPNAAEKNVLLMTTYSQGVRVQNSKTMTGAMLADLGVSNVADSHESLLKDFSVESLIEIDPDYILVVPMGNNAEAAQRGLDSVTQNPAWANLTAVAQGKCTMLDAGLFLYKPNDFWNEAYETLAEALGA